MQTDKKGISERKKTYLCRYHNMLQRIDYLKRDIEFCEERANSIPGPRYGTDMPRSPNRNLEAPFVKWIYRSMDDKRELDELEIKSITVKEETAYFISKLDNLDLERVLTYRYLDWMSWFLISRKMYMSVATVRRLHEKALEAFNMPDEK